MDGSLGDIPNEYNSSRWVALSQSASLQNNTDPSSLSITYQLCGTSKIRCLFKVSTVINFIFVLSSNREPDCANILIPLPTGKTIDIIATDDKTINGITNPLLIIPVFLSIDYSLPK
jgi:hypothetical protein